MNNETWRTRRIIRQLIACKVGEFSVGGIEEESGVTFRSATGLPQMFSEKDEHKSPRTASDSSV